MTRLLAFILLILMPCGLSFASEILVNTNQPEISVPFDSDPFQSSDTLINTWSPAGFYIQAGSDWQQLITPMSQANPVSVPVDFTGSTITVQFAPSKPIGPYDSMDMVPVTGDYAATPGYFCSDGDTLRGSFCTNPTTGDYYAATSTETDYTCFYGGTISGVTCTLAATVDIAAGVLTLHIPADQTLWMTGWQGSLYIAVDGVDTLIIPVEFHPTVTRQF
jgi:hypothetical protein